MHLSAIIQRKKPRSSQYQSNWSLSCEQAHLTFFRRLFTHFNAFITNFEQVMTYCQSRQSIQQTTSCCEVVLVVLMLTLNMQNIKPVFSKRISTCVLACWTLCRYIVSHWTYLIIFLVRKLVLWASTHTVSALGFWTNLPPH